MLYSQLSLNLQNGLFTSDFQTVILYASVTAPMHATSLAHLIFRDLTTITLLSEEYKLWSTKLQFLHPLRSTYCFQPKLHCFLRNAISIQSKRHKYHFMYIDVWWVHKLKKCAVYICHASVFPRVTILEQLNVDISEFWLKLENNKGHEMHFCMHLECKRPQTCASF
jgi:hypothetical protein